MRLDDAFVVAKSATEFMACKSVPNELRPWHAVRRSLVFDADGDAVIFTSWHEANRICSAYNDGLDDGGDGWSSAKWNSSLGDYGWEFEYGGGGRTSGRDRSDREDFHADS